MMSFWIAGARARSTRAAKRAPRLMRRVALLGVLLALCAGRAGADCSLLLSYGSANTEVEMLGSKESNTGAVPMISASCGIVKTQLNKDYALFVDIEAYALTDSTRVSGEREIQRDTDEDEDTPPTLVESRSWRAENEGGFGGGLLLGITEGAGRLYLRAGYDSMRLRVRGRVLGSDNRPIARIDDKVRFGNPYWGVAYDYTWRRGWTFSAGLQDTAGSSNEAARVVNVSQNLRVLPEDLGDIEASRRMWHIGLGYQF